jgi:Zn-dependent peptidase ImmA (M78 family)
MRLTDAFYKKIENQVDRLISEQGIKELPIPIEKIARAHDAEVVAFDLKEASGMLVVSNKKGTIGFNPSQSKGRQRFTIAHELGHFLLHSDTKKELFVDRDLIIKFRGEITYTPAELKQESEANAFAAAVLMPKSFLVRELKNKKYKELAENELIDELAKSFEVSSLAMTYRLKDLNMF